MKTVLALKLHIFRQRWRYGERLLGLCEFFHRRGNEFYWTKVRAWRA